MIFIDVDTSSRRKFGTSCSGDVFVSRRTADGVGVCAVLADGLGSGLQAGVAASLTGTMALEYITADVDIRRAAEMIMDALPLCPERHISYSTFTMIRADLDGSIRLIEYGNPPALHLSGTTVRPVPRETLTFPRWNGREMTYATFHADLHDRIVFCSDGVTQAGLGTNRFPFGWGSALLAEFLGERLAAMPDIGSADLAPLVVERALGFDSGVPGDDITCAVLHYRETRTLQVLTGPPFSKERDREYAGHVLKPGTRSVICGGTTAEIVGRELGRPLTMSLDRPDPEIPATSEMDGAALVTEGCITLSAAADMLQSGETPPRANGATRLRDLFLHSDRILFLVGTGVNPAHHDPSLPVELEIRRTLIRRLKTILEEKYFKQVIIEFY
jgi:hypothetical protein